LVVRGEEIETRTGKRVRLMEGSRAYWTWVIVLERERVEK
jgi:hypothetical protein